MQEENKNKKSEAALREEKILEFWRENKIFEKSVKQREGSKEFVFYEGPPTANGKPGIHHVEARSFKDAIPRYRTMCGFHVRRKGGWDTHGLPVELQVEKKLGLNSKKAIEEYGVAKFNQECKESVWDYLDVWNKFTKRIGFWVDQENPYVTYENSYIESLWSVVKRVDEQKLLYKDYKVVPWCPRCGTALSSHELAQGYEDVKDLSLYVKFKIVGFDKAYFLAWTTTPWTLPGNVGLAVGKDIEYVEIKKGEEILVLAKDRLSIIDGEYEIIATHKGSEMVGMQYEPLFSYLSDTILDAEKTKLQNAFKVYVADFVNVTDGTGIVHTAVMYGQDDFVLGTEVGLPKHHLVNLEGRFIKGTGFLEGRFVKEKDENGKPTLDVDIIKYLTDKNLFFNKENYQHSYPHCWRCHTALIYYARDSWYIRMSDPKIKEKLISENQKINWEPAYTRDGRFGEWLREIKDWAISRERYWGTPLPVWMDQNSNFRVLGGIHDIKKFIKKSDNKYFLMRHGGSVANSKNVDSLVPGEPNDALTNEGREQVRMQAKNFKEKIDIIVSSNFTRTRQTAEVVADTLGLDKSAVIVNEELREERAVSSSDETSGDIRKRMISVMTELEKEYSGKNILIVSHEFPIRILLSAHEALSEKEESINLESKYTTIKNAEVFECSFVLLPRNNFGQVDLHRPFIDEIELFDEDGFPLVRTKEVMDVWFDSGAMPFAQDHYPFENKEWLEGKGYPADFISEAIDQTRGWFYTLHAVGILMGRGLAYKNVICLGHLLDAKGKKMSKSLGNVVEPFEAIDKYGVDTLRLWMYSVNQPGESKNFDEKTVMLLQQQFFGLLYNVLAFYELYRDPNLEKDNKIDSKNILDQWILAKLNELINLSTENLNNYKLLEPVRSMRDFIGDLSTWYLRRSRDRIKEGDEEAKKTLYFVLKTLAKIIAPFAPFSAEDIWLRLKTKDDVESVHLTDWPASAKASAGEAQIIKDMQITRDICTAGNALRQKVNIPIRQPLSMLTSMVRVSKEYEELIKEELNVKNVTFKDLVVESEPGYDLVELDTNITPELKQEGDYRELVRALQDMRKNLELTPSDIVTFVFDTGDVIKEVIEKFENEMKKTILASKIEFKTNDGVEIKIGKFSLKVKIEK
jgi:isoleucyl-tRNA synthetase